MTTVKVDLKHNQYPIDIVSDRPARLAVVIKKYARSGRFVVLTNKPVWNLQRERFCSAIPKEFELNLLQIGDGEKYKSLKTAEKIYSDLIELKIRRNDLLVALGGGVIGDLAGFIAATYQRGIPFVQVPTTLLSQVDSSVGGKVAVNHPKGKNMIGAFYQPKHVLIDTAYLDTLPTREYASGAAEVVKTAMLSGSRSFGRLEKQLSKIVERHPATMRAVIEECVSFKAKVVVKDEKDLGLRAILNLGHTLGHAIEVLASYGRYLHGEAVSIGLVYACLISAGRGYMPSSDVERVVSMLLQLGLPVSLPDLEFPAILEQFDRDKKKVGSKHSLVLMKSFGNPVLEEVSSSELVRAYREHVKLSAQLARS